MKTRKIGIFGSSFNPIHIGHLILAEETRIRLGLNEVLFVPTANPYHKKVDLLPYQTRYDMTELAIKDNPYFQISDIEKNLSKNSYSYDVVNMLKEDHEGDFYFIIGSDSFNQLRTWYRYEDFIQLVNLVVFKRPSYDIEDKYFEDIQGLTDKEIIYYEDLQMQISSTSIRASIKNGHIPRYTLDQSTREFILKNSLWQD